jgi:hypothetical protein
MTEQYMLLEHTEGTSINQNTKTNAAKVQQFPSQNKFEI